MKKIDWYIFKKFITTFFFSIFLFTVIAVVIDISEKADDFVHSGLPVHKIITDYYFGFIPHIVALLFPLFVFIAVIFFTSKMAGKSEIIAILASGTTYFRWLRPYFVGALFLATILWFSNHYIVPNANKARSAFETVYIDGNSSYENLVKNRDRVASDLYIKIDSFTYAGIYNYDTISKHGGPFFMYKLKGTEVTENKRAEGISWDAKKNSWRLEGETYRTINGLHETVTYPAEEQIKFEFKPNDLNHDKYTKDKLTTSELRHFVALEEKRGSETLNELKVELGRRDATAFSVILLTLIGAVVAGKKVRGGSGVHMAIGFITAALFIVADKFSTVFSTKGNFPPTLAAWMPNIIFTVVAIIFYRNAPK